jgi:molybdate transport system substrate-binding protein
MASVPCRRLSAKAAGGGIAIKGASHMLTYHRRMVLGALCVAALSAAANRPHGAEPVMIFAAATLKGALDPVVEAARAALHVPITIVYGPSPALVKQLDNGAPADIFFSADSDWMDDATARGLVDPSTRVNLLSSKLVLIAPAGGAQPVTIAPGFPLVAMLGNGRLAICDPMMMPAGRYGRSALQALAVWESVKGRVAMAADVLAALTYVSRREAALGIVFDTDARLDTGVSVIGRFPDNTHQSIVYPVARVARSQNPDASRVLDFLAANQARLIFEAYGYAVLPR